jgi:hypothetical protein
MSQPTREHILDTIEKDWGTYVQNIQALPRNELAAFLAHEGFARPGDLLGHIIAWWKEGLTAVRAMVADPAYESPDYDVDAFNAQAVEVCQNVDDEAIMKTFEETRQAWAQLVKELPAEAFENEKIVKRLDIELIEHLREHVLSPY